MTPPFPLSAVTARTARVVAGWLGPLVWPAVALLSIPMPSHAVSGAPAAAAMPPLSAASNPLLGRWARTASACAVPEFEFDEKRAWIHVDADGTPTHFQYPAVRYLGSATQVVVQLGRKHPLAKTASKTELVFSVQSGQALSLQRLGGRQLPLVRCPPSSG